MSPPALAERVSALERRFTRMEVVNGLFDLAASLGATHRAMAHLPGDDGERRVDQPFSGPTPGKDDRAPLPARPGVDTRPFGSVIDAIERGEVTLKPRAPKERPPVNEALYRRWAAHSSGGRPVKP